MYVANAFELFQFGHEYIYDKWAKYLMACHFAKLKYTFEQAVFQRLYIMLINIFEKYLQ